MSVVLFRLIKILHPTISVTSYFKWQLTNFYLFLGNQSVLSEKCKWNLRHRQYISEISKQYTSFHASPVSSMFKKESSGTCCVWPLHSIHPLFKIKPAFLLWPVLYSPLSNLLTLAKLMRQRLSASLLSWQERPAHSSLAVIAPLCVSSRKSGSRTPPVLALRGNNMLPPTSPMDLRPCHL